MVTSGNRGDKVRSDCFVSLEIKNSGCISLEIKSKVKVLYGKSIKKLLLEILGFYEIQHATLVLEDYGALPFTIAARVEAAIKKNLYK